MNMNNEHNTLEQMDVRQLEEQLQLELEKNGSADPERVKSLLRIIDRRKDTRSFSDDVNVQAACDKYRAHQRKQMARKKKHFRIAAAALAVVLMLVIIPQAVQAENLWDVLARWTESVFALFNPSGAENEVPEVVFRTDNPGLQQVYDAVTQMGVEDPVVPMWVPEGYTLEECSTTNMQLETYVHARLKSADSELVFDVKIYTGESAPEYYKDETTVEKWEHNGVDHYIMKNKDNVVVVWTRDNIECFLSVDCQEDVLYEMLRSIYITEEN